jgi:hypothetical protein
VGDHAVKDNGSVYAKLIMRQRIRRKLGPDARVLEGFAGEGRIFRACWAGLAGVCFDEDRNKVTAAARERPGWTCYETETERALEYGLAPYPFDVVDLDPYGSPWRFVRAWATSDRGFADRTDLVLTDGYFGQSSLAAPNRLLFPEHAGSDARITISASFYLERVRARLDEWTDSNGLQVERIRSSISRHMVFYHAVITRRAP